MTDKDPKDMTASELMRYLHDRNSSCSCFMCNKVPGKMHYGERRPKCSECGYGLGDSRWAYCPSCGAKVVG